MSLVSAAAEIHEAESEAEARRLDRVQFRSRQKELDDLIGRLEDLVLDDEVTTPAAILDDVVATLESVHGRELPWLRNLRAPLQVLDHVFVAEGVLRQRYYGLDDLVLRESA